EGRDVADLPLETLAQRVGYVFQDPDHQLFAATVAEEVAFGPRNLGLSAAEVDARVAEALAAVELHEREADPFVLDKGARLRLAVRRGAGRLDRGGRLTPCRSPSTSRRRARSTACIRSPSSGSWPPSSSRPSWSTGRSSSRPSPRRSSCCSPSLAHSRTCGGSR